MWPGIGSSHAETRPHGQFMLHKNKRGPTGQMVVEVLVLVASSFKKLL